MSTLTQSSQLSPGILVCRYCLAKIAAFERKFIMSGAEDIEKIKLDIVDYLATGNLKGAVDYVRHVAPILGLSGAMKFVKQVQAEVEPAPQNTKEQNGHIAQQIK